MLRGSGAAFSRWLGTWAACWRAGGWIAAAVFGTLVTCAAVRLPAIQDETYYWTWGQAPGWRFVDHPPGVALVLAASARLFGRGLLGLRAPAVGSLLATAALTAGAAARLGRERLGRERGGASDAAGGDLGISARRLALLLLAGAPMFAIGYLPGTPDPLQGAAAALAAYALVRALAPGPARGRDGWAALAGFVLVASVLIKHSSALLAAGALAGLAATAEGRRALARPAPWLGALAGALALVPWLRAELSGAGGSLSFQGARVLGRGSARGWLALPVFAGGLVVALGPAGAWLMAPLPRTPRGAAPAARALSGGALLLLGACVVPVAVGGGELNWSMPALVFVAPSLAVRLASVPPPLRRAALASAWVGVAITAVLLVHVAHPFLPIPPARDTTRRGAGFPAVAAEVHAAASAVGATAIVTRRYQLASELRFNLADALPVLELGSARPSQYDRWSRPALCAGDRAIAVLSTPELPVEVPARPLAAPRALLRADGPAPIETLWVTPLQATADAFPPDARCRARVAGTPVTGTPPPAPRAAGALVEPGEPMDRAGSPAPLGRGGST